MATLIRRVQADLPITNEEATALGKHLDECIRRQQRTEITLGVAAMCACAFVGGLIAAQKFGWI